MGLQSIKNRSSGQENADAIFAMVLFENIDKHGGVCKERLVLLAVIHG